MGRYRIPNRPDPNLSVIFPFLPWLAYISVSLNPYYYHHHHHYYYYYYYYYYDSLATAEISATILIEHPSSFCQAGFSM